MAASLRGAKPTLSPSEAIGEALELLRCATEALAPPPDTLDEYEDAVRAAGISSLAEPTPTWGDYTVGTQDPRTRARRDAVPGTHDDAALADDVLLRRLGKNTASPWNPDEVIAFDDALMAIIEDKQQYNGKSGGKKVKKLRPREKSFQLFLEWKAYVAECLGDSGLLQELFDEIYEHRSLAPEEAAASLKRQALAREKDKKKRVVGIAGGVPIWYEEIVAFALRRRKKLSHQERNHDKAKQQAKRELASLRRESMKPGELLVCARLYRRWAVYSAFAIKTRLKKPLKDASYKRSDDKKFGNPKKRV